MSLKPQLYLFLLLFVAVFTLKSQAQSGGLRELIENGRSAYEKGDFESSLNFFIKANELRPYHPMITRLLVRLNSLTNRKQEAFESLNDLRLIDADVEFLLHSDLQVIQGDKNFKEVQKAFDQMNAIEGDYDTVAVVTQRKLHPESIVVLPNDGGVLLGSVHEKRIVQIAENGTVDDWVPSGAHGLYAVMGMKVDEKRNLLWVASTAIPQMIWYSDELEDKAAVFAFDLTTKALVKKYEPSIDGAYWFGDLAIAEDGTVYISNSQTPEIYRIESVDGEIVKWRTFPDLIALQGLTVVDKDLFFADYILGVFSVPTNAEAKTPIKINHPDGTIMKGIDGLYAKDNRLITIQNGVYPNRISSWKLSSDNKTVTEMKFLNKANSLFGEPTLGTVHEDTFYYIANSQWNGYQRDGTILEDKQLDDIYILKLSLQD